MMVRYLRMLTAGLVLAAPIAVAAPARAEAACARVAGDFNGDGYADVAATASNTDNFGAVGIAYGPAGAGRKQWIRASQLGPNSHVRSTVSGYFDDDCYADLAIGGYKDVRVLSGSSAGLSLERIAAFTQADIPGGEGHSWFGDPLASGDFNGDGRDDLAIGAPGRSAESPSDPDPWIDDDGGAVGVLDGSASGLTAAGSRWLTGPAIRPYDRLGSALAAGDFNGDGSDDLAAGAPERDGMKGAVLMFRGARAGIARTPAVTLDQDSSGVPGTAEREDLFGSRLAAGDLTGDGRDDLVVSSPGEAIGSAWRTGSVAVLKGSAAGVTGSGAVGFDQGTANVPGSNEADDVFGRALAIGDVNGDGRPDLVVGTPGEDVGTVQDAGAVTVLPGTASGPVAQGSRYLDQNSPGVPGSNEVHDEFGAALRVIPGALVVGAPSEETGSGSATNTGAFTVLTGNLSAGTFIGPAQFSGVAPADHYLGYHLS